MSQHPLIVVAWSWDEGIVHPTCDISRCRDMLGFVRLLQILFGKLRSVRMTPAQDGMPYRGV